MERIIFSFAVIVVITLSTSLTSCDKNEENNDENGKVKLLVTYIRDGAYVTYEYDNLNRITKCLYYNEDGEHVYFQTLAYENGDLKEHQFGWPESEYYEEKYSKVGNKITITAFDVVSSMDLNNDGYPIMSEGYYLSSGGGDWYMPHLIFEYQNGNLMRLSLSNDIEEYVYSNDDKKSPFHHCKTPKWFMFYHFTFLASRNNIIEQKAYKYDEYVYDSDGYPIKCTVTDNDGNKFSIEFEYKTIDMIM